MSLLRFRTEQTSRSRSWDGIGDSGESAKRFPLIGHCSNSECLSGWLQLFRSRKRPVFEGGWTCSPDCTRERLERAVHRELDGWMPNLEPHRHRIPLGLLMLERGWITSHQLQRAVAAQKNEGKLRIGEWLVKQGAASEALVARALSVQWGCPVLSAANLTLSKELLPRLFIQAFGALPLEDSSGRMLYLGFEQSADPALAFSMERIVGKRIECGILPSSSYVEVLGRVDDQTFPLVQVAEAVSESAAARLFAKSIEREQPISSRLVRAHEWLWLRMTLKAHSTSAAGCACVRDLVCRVGPF